MDQLSIWYYTPSDRPKGIPERYDTTYTDVFNPKKPMHGADADWLDYNRFLMPFPPDQEQFKLPKSMFLVVKKHKQVLFDFFPLETEYKVVSEPLLEFMHEHGLRDGYETATITVVSTSGKELSEKPYYFLRFSRFNDELLDFDESGKVSVSSVGAQFVYPEIQIKEPVKQQVFFSDKVCYGDCMFVDKSLEPELLARFYSPIFYQPEDYVITYKAGRVWS